MAQIELSGLNRTFRLGDSEVRALRNVSLEFAAGDYAAIMGPSGSGKSTLLNVLGLLDRPDSGRHVRFHGPRRRTDIARVRGVHQHHTHPFQPCHLAGKARFIAVHIELPTFVQARRP